MIMKQNNEKIQNERKMEGKKEKKNRKENRKDSQKKKKEKTETDRWEEEEELGRTISIKNNRGNLYSVFRHSKCFTT